MQHIMLHGIHLYDRIPIVQGYFITENIIGNVRLRMSIGYGLFLIWLSRAGMHAYDSKAVNDGNCDYNKCDGDCDYSDDNDQNDND